jgi:hypothetical protein
MSLIEKEEEILHIGAKGGKGEREREIGTYGLLLICDLIASEQRFFF